jgi:hypothetical protein
MCLISKKYGLGSWARAIVFINQPKVTTVMTNDKSLYFIIITCFVLILCLFLEHRELDAFLPSNVSPKTPTQTPTLIPKPTQTPTLIPKPTQTPTLIPKPTPAPTLIPKPTPAPTLIPKPTPAPILLPYSNRILGIELRYPIGWAITDLKDTIEIAKEPAVTYVQVHIQDLGNFNNLKEYVNDDIASRKKSRVDFKFIDSLSKTTISGNIPAYNATYTFLKTADPGKGETQKNLRIWTVDNDKSYTILYSSTASTYERYFANANAIINSIKISVAKD